MVIMADLSSMPSHQTNAWAIRLKILVSMEHRAANIMDSHSILNNSVSSVFRLHLANDPLAQSLV